MFRALGLSKDAAVKSAQKRFAVDKVEETDVRGTLRLKIIRGHRIAYTGKVAPALFATATLGECKVMTEVIEGGANPKFEQSYELEVGDVTADLCVLIHKVESMGARPIGRVTVPLANLLTLRGPKPAAASWYRILPISPPLRGGLKENKLEGILPEVKGSGLSIPKDYSSLGFLQLGLHLRLKDPSPAVSYLTSAAFEIDRVGADEFSTSQLEEQVYRLTALLDKPSFWAALEQPTVLAYMQLAWWYVCFRLPVFLHPLALVAFVGWCGAMSWLQMRVDGIDSDYYKRLKIWEHEVGIPCTIYASHYTHHTRHITLCTSHHVTVGGDVQHR
jgi:hypothetical protein